jgi:hypothetical protein
MVMNLSVEDLVSTCVRGEVGIFENEFVSIDRSLSTRVSGCCACFQHHELGLDRVRVRRIPKF